MSDRKILLIMGSQGSGKGTQAQRLAERFGYAIIETGRLLRHESEKKTELGERISAHIAAGELIDDELVFSVIRMHIASLPASKSIILDGFPRTVAQAHQLEAIINIYAVVNITLTEDEAVKRISERLVCPLGHIYNLSSATPKKKNFCDIDRLPLMKREDDTADAIRKRLAIYRRNSAAILSYYDSHHELITVNGNDTIDAVEKEILEKLDAYDRKVSGKN